MEEEFKELFFPFESGESSSAPVPATEHTDGPGVQLSLTKEPQLARQVSRTLPTGETADLF